MKKHTSLKNLVLSAMFLAIGLVLPFFIGQIPAIGKMLLPMHIPVLLCGLICGWQWGLGVGFVLPLLRSVLFGFPAMYPNAIGMAFELSVYGLVIGYLYAHSKYCTVVSDAIARHRAGALRGSGGGFRHLPEVRFPGYEDQDLQGSEEVRQAAEPTLLRR